jgi:2-keto-3-deoxy-L-rhamnonate aldolase RhmA
MNLELEKAKKFKARLRAGESCFGVQIGLSDPAIAEIFGRAGFDWMVVDTEHSANNAMTLQSMLQAAAHTSAIVLGRPLRLDPDEIRRLLDVGAQGILCPFINTGDEARRLVQACRYPPEGIRGFGPRRAGVYGFDEDEYFLQANQALSCIVIIESRQAVENIKEIVSVEGIDGVVIGPMDLSISLNVYKQLEHPSYVEAVNKVRNACMEARKAMGTGCYSLEHAAQRRRLGDVLLLVGGDEIFLKRESLRWMDTLRKDNAGK